MNTATRPQTLYGLADSPIDLAAFMPDHGDGLGQPGLVQQVLDRLCTYFDQPQAREAFTREGETPRPQKSCLNCSTP